MVQKLSKMFLFLLILTETCMAQSIKQDLFCPEYITIYVHGTVTRCGLKLLSRFFTDLSFGQQGIHHIDELPKNALLRSDAALLHSLDPCRFDQDHYYTFGWSGSLSVKARRQAGQELYEELVELLSGYKQRYGRIPKLRILTFSHGGNVALHMLEHTPFFEYEKVHLELVLIAVPVQKTTEKLIEHAAIAKSYVISSTRDLLQVADRYRFENKYYWPKRFFDTQCKNCHQVKIQINDTGLCHTEMLRGFMIHLPYVLQYVDSQNSFLLCACKESQNAAIVHCPIQDSGFIFFHGLNLVNVVRGKRK